LVASLLRRIADLGTHPALRHADVVRNRHTRFANLVSLIVLAFIFQCAALAIAYETPSLLPVYAAHAAGIALVPALNQRGQPVAAATTFGVVAVLFVSLYSLLFGLESLNFAFLPMISLLQFFFFATRSRSTMVFLAGFSAVAYVAVLIVGRWESPLLGPMPDDLVAAQRLNSMIGLLLLSIALGAFAHATLSRADDDVRSEQEKSELLLLNMLPAEVVQELKTKGRAEARQFEQVTVLFTDFQGFTAVAERMSPQALVRELHTLFQAFDRIVAARGIEKIKTIGDAYLCAGGLPDPMSCTAADVVRAGLEMQAFVRGHNARRVEQGEPPFAMRIGIHTGPVVAGIVGERKFAYDLWGDAVNTASRMESSGEVDRVNISASTRAALLQAPMGRLDGGRPALRFVPRGPIHAKGKGLLEMYFVEVDTDASTPEVSEA
jgi:class 3 adenylate cyclase